MGILEELSTMDTDELIPTGNCKLFGKSKGHASTVLLVTYIKQVIDSNHYVPSHRFTWLFRPQMTLKGCL
jgi:hypothetical protein